jgi:anti-sigma B factor antagonist
MKPENSVSAPGPAGAALRAAANTRGEMALRLSLEAAGLGSTVVLHCEGQVISRVEVRALSSIIADVLPSAGRMVVDLAGVASLDSHALGELVLSHLWADAAGFALTIASPNDSVRGLFESTRLDSIFDVYPSVDEALAAMQRGEVHLA